MRRYGLIADWYADDIVFAQDDAAESIKRIEASVMEVKKWMAINWLKLNDENTLSLLLRTPSVGPLSNIREIIIGENNITPSPSTRNLGAIFDEHLSMEAHVNSVCCSSFFHHSKSARYVDLYPLTQTQIYLFDIVQRKTYELI